MSLDFTEAIEDIKTTLASIQNVEIIDAHDNATLTNGVVKPYIVLTFGGPIRAARDRGIVASKHDTSLVWCLAECVSNDLSVARKLKFDVLGALVDFEPDNSGAMVLDGGYSYTRAQTNAIPLRYVETARLVFHHNLQWTP